MRRCEDAKSPARTVGGFESRGVARLWCLLPTAENRLRQIGSLDLPQMVYFAEDFLTRAFCQERNSPTYCRLGKLVGDHGLAYDVRLIPGV